MNAPYYQDDSITLYHGHALAVTRALASAGGSVDCIVTSPPYFGLRDYGADGQYGLEDSPAEYVENMRELFAELREMLSDDGTLWLNLGDTYYSGKGAAVGPDKKNPARRGFVRPTDKSGAAWAKPKSLLGIPWRVAFALQDDGWILRNAIIWHKPNSMPESVSDRLSSRYEHVFLFSKSRHYWFDLDPIREPHMEVSQKRAAPHRAAPGKSARLGLGYPAGVNPQTARLDQSLHPSGRNPGDVWVIPTVPFAEAHFAVYPPAIPNRCIQAGCKPGGTVLDPFSGSGTTGMVAQRLGRKYIGIDLNSEYLDMSLQSPKRLAGRTLDFGGGV